MSLDPQIVHDHAVTETIARIIAIHMSTRSGDLVFLSRLEKLAYRRGVSDLKSAIKKMIGMK